MAKNPLESRPELGAATGASSSIAYREVELGWVSGWLFETLNLKHELNFIVDIPTF